jgi:hypothetical protein
MAMVMVMAQYAPMSSVIIIFLLTDFPKFCYDQKVAVDIDYHRTMFELHQRVNSKEIIIGW